MHIMFDEHPFKVFEETEWQEERELLQREMGVAFSTRAKDGSFMSVEEQIACANEMGLGSVQFDFRNRLPHAVEKASETLSVFHELNDGVSVSIHGETPKIDETTLKIKNAELLAKELDIARSVDAESFTVHPPSIRQDLFDGLDQSMRDRIVSGYCDVFAEKINAAIKEGKRFSVAIENMTLGGEDGAWGQKPEDIKFLIQKIEEMLVGKYDIHPDIAHECVGATIDINHALAGEKEASSIPEVLERWFQELGEYIRVIHLYTPGDANTSLMQKFESTLNLAARYSPAAQLFMESKQKPEVTKHVFASVKNKKL
jgi:endonuclease IV